MSKTQLLAVAFVVSTVTAIGTSLALRQAERAVAVSKEELRSAAAELEKSKNRQRELEAELGLLRQNLALSKESAAVHGDAAPAASALAAPAPTATSAPDQSYRVRARISAIEKFVPLNDEQRSRLEEKFKRDVAGAKPEEGRDELAEILGQENAEYYRKETRRAFESAEMEEREKDVLLLSRRLSLNPEQEQKLNQAMAQADAMIEEQRTTRGAQSGAAAKMEDRLRLIIEENNLRQKILNEQLQKIFSAEQYRLYLEQHLGSAEGNFPVWHESE